MNAQPSFSSMSEHMVVLCSEDRSVLVWGMNQNGSLGIDLAQDDLYLKDPQKMLYFAEHTIKSVACGYNHTLLLTTDGQVFAWGCNSEGQLGLGDNTHRAKPCLLPSLAHITYVACGGHASMAVDHEGVLYTWGSNYASQLGLGDKTNKNTPQRVTAIPHRVIAVSGGQGHTVAVTDEGHLYAWGRNHYGQLGLGNTENYPLPQMIPGLKNFTKVACGFGHSMAITKGGSLFGWGANGYGQLGLGEDYADIVTSPQFITDSVAEISCGYHHSLALLSNGWVLAWGYNTGYELGLGYTAHQKSPKRVLVGYADQICVNIGCGRQHSFAITDQGLLYVWGSGEHGALGLGDLASKAIPTPITNITFRPPVKVKIAATKQILPLPSPSNYPDLFTRQDGYEVAWHRAVVEVRFPNLLPFLTEASSSISKASKSVIEELRSFTYTDYIEFERLNVFEVLALTDIGKRASIPALVYQCQLQFLDVLPPNAQDALVYCVNHAMEPETSWILSFLAKRKLELDVQHVASLPTELIVRLAKECENPQSYPPRVMSAAPKPLSETLDFFTKDKSKSDFELVVTHGTEAKTFKLHKFLICRWGFFNTFLIQRDVHEHETPMPLSCFKKLVRYFYAQSVQSFTLTDCGWILSLADYYALENEEILMEYCQETLDTGLTDLNWVEGLLLGVALDNDDLKERAINSVPKSVGALPQVITLVKDLLVTTTNQEKEINEQKEEIACLKVQKVEQDEAMKKLESQFNLLLERFERLEKP